MDNQNNNGQNPNYNQGYNGQPNQNYNQGYNGQPNQNYNQGYNGQPNQNYNQGYGQPNQNYNQGYGQQGPNYNQGYGQPNQNYNQGYNQYNNYNQNFNQGYNGPMPNEFREEKNIAVCIILAFVTCSIYMWFWMYSMVKKIRMLANDTSDMVGEYLLLMLVPYYNVYWVYTRGKKISEEAARRGIQISDNSVLYLILNLLGLSIVSYAMIQNDLNKLARML